MMQGKIKLDIFIKHILKWRINESSSSGRKKSKSNI